MNDSPERSNAMAPAGHGKRSDGRGDGHGGREGGADSVLIVDDDPMVRRIFEERLGAEGIDIIGVAVSERMMEVISSRQIDLLMLDERLDGRSCWGLLESIRGRSPGLPVILLFDHPPTVTEQAIAEGFGVVDVLSKRGDPDRMLRAVRHGVGSGRMRIDVETPPPIMGESEPMQRVRTQISKIAPTSSRVLISGESGTGKELVALWIHHLSPRASKPFVAVNCSAIPVELFEAELFGHEKGAFTGAIQRRIGKMEAAGEGTLFLDEIAELQPSAQAKLLRALQENRFTRVGGNDPIRLQARVLAATNQPLHQLVHQGAFRLDLFHRIAVIPLTLPPLRDHREDIPLLANSVVERLVRRDVRYEGITFTPSAMLRLQELDWPGNVRELFNMVERIVVMSDRPEITGEDVMLDVEAQSLLTRPRPESLSGAEGSGMGQVFSKSDTFEAFREASERWFLEQKLREHHWNVLRTAEAIRMPRSLLYSKIRKHGLRRG